MFKICKIESIVKPEKFESLHNGIWYYNYDITEEVKQITLSEETELTVYSYALVRITGPVTVDKCYEAILKAFKDESNTTLYDVNPSKDTEELVNEIYFNVRVDFGLEEPLTELDKAKKRKIKLIELYDTSSEVNSFFLNNQKVWLDKATRVGLMNSITIEKEAGKLDTTLWFNGIKIIVGCTLAQQMLSILELYALNCYNKTAEHRNNVQQLSEVKEVESYDHTQGYPDKPKFNV